MIYVIGFISHQEEHPFIPAQKAQAHQNAVKVISSHIAGRSWQQSPCLSLVVCDESLDVIIHQFVGEVHAVYPLNLQKENRKWATI